MAYNEAMAEQLKLTFCSGVGTVTGSNFLLETPAGSNILVDCGMVQGERFATEDNAKPFAFMPSTIQALCVTHAHLDHVGRIPKLVKDGFKGTIYSTPETRALAQLVLEDAVGILANEARENNAVPLYGSDDVAAVWPLWKTIAYHAETALTDDVSILLKDAGHILGSAMIQMAVTSAGQATKILFSGDLGNTPAPLLRDTEAIGEVDYLTIESTYGDRNHEPRSERAKKFQDIITQTLAVGGTLVIPAFSIDRTQVLLYELNNLVEQKKIPRVPVYVDSPMATKATQIYAQSTALFNEAVRAQIGRGDNIFAFPHLEYTISQNQSRDIEHQKGAKIILAGSGMSVGGRVISHEAKHLPDPRSTILLVGYQTTGSLGRALADGAKSVTIHGQKIAVKARIETLYGYSAHKDSDHLLEFVATASDRLKKTFVVMGEPKAEMFLAQRINDELGVKAVVPEGGVAYPQGCPRLRLGYFLLTA
jgi:metallo-beta-lactamase family protein